MLRMSVKLNSLLAAKHILQELAEAQLVEDFVEHLADWYEDYRSRNGSEELLGLRQWLGSIGDYGTLVKGRVATQAIQDAARETISQVTSLSRFAESLGTALNERYKENDAGNLTVSALETATWHDDGLFLLKFTYDSTYWWGD